MGAIGQTINPRKLYRFAVECEGLQTAYVQKVKLPKLDIKSAEHGEGPFKIKTASKVEVGQIELDTLKPADSAAVWWKDWVALVVNLGSGAMGHPDVYKKSLSIVEFAPDGETIIDRWDCYGCFPAEVEVADMDKLADGNAIDKVKLNCDMIVPQGGGSSNINPFGSRATTQPTTDNATQILRGLGL
jgi:phage tail-like protein